MADQTRTPESPATTPAIDIPDDLIDLRPSISDQVKLQIAQSLAAVPAGKKGALLVLADEHGARAMLAARLNDSWKVAMSAGSAWTGHVTGTVAVEGSW